MTAGTSSVGNPYFGRYQDGWIDSANLRLHYTEWNPSAPDTVVLVHGLNVQLHTWDPIADLLSDRYRVVCVDLRGHGDSDWAREGYRLDSFVADLRATVETLGIDRFHLVGHSLGARIAVAFAGRYPDRVRHVVLSDTGPETTRAGALAARDVVGGAGNIRGFRNEAEALEHFEKVHPEWLAEFRELHVRWQLRRNWAGKLVFKADPDLFWILGSVAKDETAVLWENAGRITAPVLLCIGERSAFFDADVVERTKAGFRALEVRYFPTGHYIPRERPAEFTEAVRQFLSR
jgi:pimeloyl-ACP methyl ester carboxylesterase